jgi:MoaA/NifB/PqqE/SkfB family radical SAM enzyme
MEISLKDFVQWNYLEALSSDLKHLDFIPAHNGDFFPETPFDHIEIFKKSLEETKTLTDKAWPLIVDFDITQTCTSDCVFCYSRPYFHNDEYKNARLSFEVFEKLVRELAEGGTKYIRFTGGGEPLMHPQFTEFIGVPHKYGLKCTCFSNGDLLTEAICEKVIEHLDYFRVSINAHSNSVRNRLHRSEVSTNMNNLFQQIENLTNLRGKKMVM